MGKPRPHPIVSLAVRAWLWVAGLLVGLASPARADAPVGDRVVLVGGDAALRDAVRAAFVPAGISVLQVSEDQAPRAGSAAEGARALSGTHAATGTIWLVVAGDRASTTLYVYDREEDRILVRTLPYAPPLDAAQNAEVARGARTMLRALRGLPDTAPPLAPPPEPAPAPAPPPPEPAPAPTATGVRLAVQGAFGLRLASGDGTTAEGRLDVSLRVGMFRIALGGDVAGATALDGPFKGEARERAIAVSARMPWALTPRVWVIPGLGLAGHAVAVSGTGPPGQTTFDEHLFLPALRAEVGVLVQLAPIVSAGVLLSFDVSLSSPTVEVRDRVAYETSDARGFFGLALVLGAL